MGKYSGNLHKLIDSACTSNSTKKWDQVLSYLEGHTINDPEEVEPPDFESPLAPNMIPSPELERELFDRQGPKSEDSPLKIAARSAPANIVAALCHLGAEAAEMTDSRDRLPIHVACKRSSEDPETEKVLMVLAKCFPESLLHRDDSGRTPLHWLVWFHAKTRSSEIVRFFCQEMPYDLFLDLRQPKAKGNEPYPLPEMQRPCEDMEIPYSASIVHDSCHGALPLHYAVMQGASKEVIRALIYDYPGSVAVGDRRGRSPLAWYLGAGSLTERYKTDIFGESNDPNVVPWRHTRLSIQLIQLLVSSKSARMVDEDMKRTPLHWACHFFAHSRATSSKSVDNSEEDPSISNKIFRILVDHNIEALTSQDRNGETPLHVMFSVTAEIQYREQQRMTENQTIKGTEINLTNGGPTAFNPPKQLVELLLKCPDTDGHDIGHNYNENGQPLVSAASLENEKGFLPLHTALSIASSSECIELLIKSHPTGLVHASEEQMQTPLVHAFSSQFSAPLQPVDSLKFLLASYPTSRHGTYMDGQLAIKMEDVLGMYPIHYACQNQVSLEALKLLVDTFDQCARYQNSDGDLPIHSLLSKECLFSPPKHGFGRGASLAKSLDLLIEEEKEWQNDVNEIQKHKMKILLEPLDTPQHLEIASSAHGMTPLHVAIAFGVLPYERVFRMLDICPQANRLKTTEKGHEYSCIQLHDFLKDTAKDLKEWQAVRELLYSFNPLIDSHRRDEALLNACVQLIRMEITGHGSFHLSKSKKFNLMSAKNASASPPIAKDSTRINRSEETVEYYSEDEYLSGDDDDDDDFSENKNLQQTSDSGKAFQLSPVCERLWCFFVAYNDHKCPEDNYLKQVQSILEGLEFDIVEKLIDLALPEYANEFMKSGRSPTGLTLRDIASPKVKALFEGYYYFVGRFEFSSNIDGILLHRSPDNDTVYIRASEHILGTTEYQPPKTYDPGMAEESIWNTGEMVRDEDGYLASQFRDTTRPVYIKFTKDESTYNCEVRSRSKIGMKEGDTTLNHILPLVGHFDASIDGRYKLDTADERFRILQLYGGESICLSDYPFALVYPYTNEGDLHDYFFHQGLQEESEIADIGLQVAKALKLMHEKSLIHGNISMRCVNMLPVDSEIQNPKRNWAISNFSGSKAGFMGAIAPNGSALFQTGLLAPEMFTKISQAEIQMYKDYWEKVEENFDIELDRIVKEPFVDITTGCSYVVRCHYVLGNEEKNENELLRLPYELMRARETADLWCLGILLYTLCSGGRQLFPVNLKSGHILDHQDIVKWDIDLAKTKIFENVNSPLAQDLLLQLLSPLEERMNVTMDSIISHPFFFPGIQSQTSQKIIEQRNSECAAHMRSRMKMIATNRETNWLASRTVNVNCWNFDVLTTIRFSSSEIIRKLIGQSNSIPSSFILLPYKLSSKNKKAKLSPTTKKDVERAERMGILLLRLAKTLAFGSLVEEVIEKPRSGHKLDARLLLESVQIPSNGYKDLKEEFYRVAADHIESFRADPRTVIAKLVERRYQEIRNIFREARKGFLYLVDEQVGVPLVGHEHAPYPLELPESAVESTLSKILPFMHACSIVMRSKSGGIAGIVRLIFEAAFVSL